MKKIAAVMLFLLALATPVWADSTHETNGGDVTNNIDNRSSATGGNASATANGGTHVQTNTQVNSQTTVNTNVATQGQQQGQIQGQSQRTKQANQQSVTVGGDNYNYERQAPAASAPGLTSAPETCMGSTSVGASSPFGGVSFGTTWKSEGCEVRMFARMLGQLGLPQAAVVLMAQNDPRVKEALKAVGIVFEETKDARKPGVGAELPAGPARIEGRGFRSPALGMDAPISTRPMVVEPQS